MRIGRPRDTMRVLCLGLGEKRIDILLMERTHAALQTAHVSHLDLPLSRAVDDPAGLGLALRKHLDAAGISTRTTLVCVPAGWCFSASMNLPELSDDDTRAYIATQAERTLPVPPGDVAYTSSIYETEPGQREVHLLALPAQCVASIETLLSSASLKCVAITVGAVTLLPSPPQAVNAIVHVGERFAEFVVGAHGAVVAVHALNALTVTVGSQAGPPIAGAARELRLSLHRLPQSIRKGLDSVKVLGTREAAAAWIEGLRAEFPNLLFSEAEEGGRLEARANADHVRPDLRCAASLYLHKRPVHPNFLPLRMSRMTEAMAFIQRRRTVSLAAGGLAVAVLFGAAFGIQAHRLARLEAKDTLLAGTAEELRALQEGIKRYQSWYDDEPNSLRSVRDLTLAFPSEGNIWLKALRIKDRAQVTCSGNASGTPAWLSTLDAVRNIAGVSDLAVSNIRGESPVEFSFTYTQQGGRNE